MFFTFDMRAPYSDGMADADFLLRLLRLAAEDDELNPDELCLAVITGGTTLVAGNANGPQRGQTVRLREVRYWPFRKGEIIVVPQDGYREPFGEGRSLAKWDIGYERFGQDWQAAKRRSDQVLSAPDRDAFAS
jgi:hypothetical protein